MGFDGRLSAKILPKLPYLRACQVFIILLNGPSIHLSEMITLLPLCIKKDP